MDAYTKIALWFYWSRGDDEEELTNDDEFSDMDELSDEGEENLSEYDEVAELFRIETNICEYETPVCNEFKKFNYLL